MRTVEMMFACTMHACSVATYWHIVASLKRSLCLDLKIQHTQTVTMSHLSSPSGGGVLPSTNISQNARGYQVSVSCIILVVTHNGIPVGVICPSVLIEDAACSMQHAASRVACPGPQ
jgi:hypothetical protein